MANEFNDFFVNIASKLKEPLTKSKHDKLQEFCDDRISQDTKFIIPPILKEKVFKFLSNIDTNKATGLDMIGPR